MKTTLSPLYPEDIDYAVSKALEPSPFIAGDGEFNQNI
jgi:hypothetical protein